MNVSKLNYEIANSYAKCASDQEIKKVIEPIFPEFDRLLKFYVKFHLFFLFLGITEIIVLISSFRFLADSAWIAFGLGFLFLTLFSYFILRLYFQTQKPLQLEDLKAKYEISCKSLISYMEGNPESYVTLANAYCKLANSLHKKESLIFRLPVFIAIRAEKLNIWMENFSSWWLFEDVNRIKELLLLGAVAEHIKVVKCEPTSYEAHAALANAYVMLSGLYASVEKIDPSLDENKAKEKKILKSTVLPEMEQKFRLTAERAIEEFKIICDYAPDDPWVHKQLAFSYHDLQMPNEEIKEYEIVLKINPDDKDTLYKLGILYFQEGFNAKGLRLYEELQKHNPKKAEQLITFYAAYTPF